jgi:hypothetical protein
MRKHRSSIASFESPFCLQDTKLPETLNALSDATDVGAIFKSALYNFSRFPVLAFEASNADISFDRLTS